MTELDMTGMDLPEPTISSAISRRDLKLLQFSTVQERKGYKAELGFSPVLFSQVCLPYKDPKNIDVWARRNGDVILKVTADVVTDPVTGLTERRYTHGIMPRLFIAYFTTEANRTNSRVIDLGKSLTEFLRALGLPHTGANAKRLRDHMRRFFGAQITFEGPAVDREGRKTSGRRTIYFKFADEMTLATDNEDEGPQSDIVRYRKDWDSEVKLSEAFFTEIMDRPVPLDLNALRQLGSSALRMDIYLWLCHKMSFVHKETFIKWETLYGQFGSQYKEPRQWKSAFIEELAAVAKVYPGLNMEEQKGYLILRPSPTPIAMIPAGSKTSKVVFAADRRAIEG